MRFAAALLCLIPLLASCENGGGGGSQGKATPDDAVPAEPLPVPSGHLNPTPTGTPLPLPTPAPFPHACSDLYDPETLPTYEIELPPETWERMQSEYLQKIENWYGPFTFRYGSETRTDVMIRNRGNNSRCGSKVQITIAFNRVDTGGRFHGVRRIDLDHGGRGCKMVEERAVLTWMREDLGLPAQCANNARLVVNGEYFGLYSNLEHVDHEFLERNFPDPDGNLYKAGWEKTTNESDPDRSDIQAFWNADTPAELDAVADLDEALVEWSAEAVSPARDNFWIYGWNYFLYNDADRGFVFVPADQDDAVPTGTDVRLSPLPARVEPANWLLDESAWREKYLDALETTIAAYDPDRWAQRLDSFWAQVKEPAHADPRLSFGETPYNTLKTRIRNRRAFLDDWIVCERSPSTAMDGDGDGYAWCRECDDDDSLVYPGATEVCGNAEDDDCDGAVDEGCEGPPLVLPTSGP